MVRKHLRAAELVARLHRIATERDVTLAEGAAYFREPAKLRKILECSGCLRDPIKRQQIAKVLDEMDHEESGSRAGVRCA